MPYQKVKFIPGQFYLDSRNKMLKVVSVKQEESGEVVHYQVRDARGNWVAGFPFDPDSIYGKGVRPMPDEPYRGR
jgi:hypothetical protein